MHNGILEAFSVIANYTGEFVGVYFVEREDDGEINRDSHTDGYKLLKIDIKEKRIILIDTHELEFGIPFKRPKCVIEKIETAERILWEIDLSAVKGFMSEEAWAQAIENAFAKKFGKEEIKYAESA
jgi:hypothetical protein